MNKTKLPEVEFFYDNHHNPGGLMKTFKLLLVILSLLVAVPIAASANNLDNYKQMVDKMDAMQAMAFANQWKWSQGEITSHVTPQEVVFEFPDKTVKKVPLPKDKMVVAIAPYLTYTHG